MKKSDLHREWARVLDMCDGTKVDPSSCCDFNGDRGAGYVQLTANPDCYKFAVAILEDKPVFVGDELYWRHDGDRFDWDRWVFDDYSSYERLSWNPQKKTFALNGVELPCPIKRGDRTYGFTLGDKRVHFFDSRDKCNTVLDAIDRLLLDNTK